MPEPTIDDIDTLVGPRRRIFAPQLRARLEALIADLPEDHPPDATARRSSSAQGGAYASSKAEDGGREPRRGRLGSSCRPPRPRTLRSAPMTFEARRSS